MSLLCIFMHFFVLPFLFLLDITESLYPFNLGLIFLMQWEMIYHHSLIWYQIFKPPYLSHFNFLDQPRLLPATIPHSWIILLIRPILYTYIPVKTLSLFSFLPFWLNTTFIIGNERCSLLWKPRTVHGSLRCPAATDPLYDAWCRCNCMVMSWLTRSMNPAIKQSILWMDTASEIWTDLKERFSHANKFRIADLQDQI